MPALPVPPVSKPSADGGYANEYIALFGYLGNHSGGIFILQAAENCDKLLFFTEYFERSAQRLDTRDIVRAIDDTVGDWCIKLHAGGADMHLGVVPSCDVLRCNRKAAGGARLRAFYSQYGVFYLIFPR